MKFNMLEIAKGRDFTPADVEGGRFYCIIGDNVARTLFGQDVAGSEKPRSL